MDPIQIDQLPHLCLKKIFSFLNLRDLAKCRAVNRRFKFYAEDAVNELIVCNEKFECNSCKTWYQTSRPIDHGSLVSPKVFASVDSSPFKLNELKFLHVHMSVYYNSSNYNLNSLCKHVNHFRQLEHLEIRAVDRRNRREPITLVLPNLKVLYVGLELRRARFILKTPKLEVLKCGDISRIQVEHPETIKRLRCEYNARPDEVDMFKNLQVLILYSRVRRFGDIRLSNWMHLRELHLNVICYDYEIIREAALIDCKSQLLLIMHQKAELEREELKLYAEDVLIIDEQQMDDYGRLSTIPFWIKNYRRLYRDSYPQLGLTDLEFNALANIELTGEFFDRFPKICRLTATGPVKRNRFEWFLYNATQLTHLSLTSTLLDQSFMERLPKLCSRLQHLKLNACRGLITNFDFILQFEQLEVFRTDQELGSLDLPTKAFRQLKGLESFGFQANRPVEIDRHKFVRDGHTLYRLSFSDFREEELKWDEMVALYEQRMAFWEEINTRIKQSGLK